MDEGGMEVMSILERLAAIEADIRHLMDRMDGMTDFHMQVLYIGLGVIATAIYLLVKDRSNRNGKRRREDE